MRLLIDEEILALVRDSGAVESLPEPRDWYSHDSPIQPASLDLHVGEIFIPGRRSKAPGGIDNPEDHKVLKTGQTVVVTTLETLRLPSDICGVGFPPAHVSELGLLMTNPGHVDPGYAGPMRFAVINFGKEPFSLTRGDPIVTLLLFRSDQAPTMDWNQRNRPLKPWRPDQKKINRLSHDFVDIEHRTRTLILKTAIVTSAIAGIFGGVMAVVLTLGTNIAVERMKRLQDMRDDISVLKTQIDVLKQTVYHTSIPSAPPPTSAKTP